MGECHPLAAANDVINKSWLRFIWIDLSEKALKCAFFMFYFILFVYAVFFMAKDVCMITYGVYAGLFGFFQIGLGLALEYFIGEAKALPWLPLVLIGSGLLIVIISFHAALKKAFNGKHKAESALMRSDVLTYPHARQEPTLGNAILSSLDEDVARHKNSRSRRSDDDSALIVPAAVVASLDSASSASDSRPSSGGYSGYSGGGSSGGGSCGGGSGGGCD